MKNEFDVIISGGGYTGLTIARTLSNLNLQVAVVEQKKHSTKKTQVSRLFAVATGSIKILTNASISEKFFNSQQQIKKVLVEDKINKKRMLFKPNDINQKNFGHMIEEDKLLKELSSDIGANCYLFSNTTVDKIDLHKQSVKLTLSDKKVIKTKLLIVTEGKKSKIIT